MPAIIELLDKKSNKDSEINFKQILKLLISQNISLQTQLNFAHEREKEYLVELTIYRQHYAQKTVQNPLKSEGYIQVGQGKDISDPDEISQYPIQSKIENQAQLESFQSTKQEIESINEAGNSPIPTESIHNQITLPESKSWDTRPKYESAEQNAGALIGTPIPLDETKKLQNKICRKSLQLL
jgi:hypothetical protein